MAVPSYLNSSLVGGATGLAGPAAQLAPLVQRQQQAATILSALPQEYANAPTGLEGAIQSLISGTAANNYNQNAATTAATLAGLLGISPQQAQGLLPQIINPAAAPLRLNTVGGILGNLQ
jgi:hypothetical protein